MTITIRTSVTLITVFGILNTPVLYAEGDSWTLRRHDSRYDIEVYQRTTAEGQTEFRGITHIDTRLDAVVALLRDVDNMPKWLYRTHEVRMLETVSDTESYILTVNNMPWPIRDREAIVLATLEQDSATQALTLRTTAAPDFAPPDERYVRMPLLESSWTITPLLNGRTRIEFRCYADPGGHLSSGMLTRFQAMLAWHAPYKTLRAMQQEILDAKYQTASLSFILEPTVWQPVPGLTPIHSN